MTLAAKRDHVLRSAATPFRGAHRCHWPGCPRAVAPAFWGCKEHWFRLPLEIRTAIWQTYRPGQELDKMPSDAYLAVADWARRWIAANAAEEIQPK